MRIGIVGDIHEPFCHPMYRRFCQDVFQKWRVNHVHFIGDIVDLHALSFHEHDPDGLSAGHEVAAAQIEVHKWYALWPKATVNIGNHDERPERLARRVGATTLLLKDRNAIWNTPEWRWELYHEFDDVGFTHGTGRGGKYLGYTLAMERRKSIGCGHIHSNFGVKFNANTDEVIYGLDTGCGIDVPAYAHAYGRDFGHRPILGCSVIIDGDEPHCFRMPCDTGEKYHRSRAGKNKVRR